MPNRYENLSSVMPNLCGRNVKATPVPNPSVLRMPEALPPPHSGNRLVSGICDLMIGDFSTTKLKYLSMPTSISVSRSMID